MASIQHHHIRPFRRTRGLESDFRQHILDSRGIIHVHLTAECLDKELLPPSGVRIADSGHYPKGHQCNKRSAPVVCPKFREHPNTAILGFQAVLGASRRVPSQAVESGPRAHVKTYCHHAFTILRVLRDANWSSVTGSWSVNSTRNRPKPSMCHKCGTNSMSPYHA